MELPRGDFSTFDMECIKPELNALKKGDVYLEVGVQFGLSLAYARQESKADVYGVDILSRLEYEGDVTFIHAPSNEAVKDWDKEIDVLFIDADHTYEGCKDDWNNFAPFVKKGGSVFFHDCDAGGPDVEKVAQEAAELPEWGELKIYKTPGKNTSMARIQRIQP